MVKSGESSRVSGGSRKDAGSRGKPKLLVIETDYTLEGIRNRQIEQSVLCRDLDGFFSHVWSVHPFATLVTSEGWAPRYGPPTVHEIAARHTFIEGKVGRFAWLRGIFLLNFVVGQVDLFFRLRRLIRRENIRVIRASSPLYVGLFGLALARTTNIPLVIRVGSNHDKFFETTGQPVQPRLMRSRRFEKIVERFVFRRADLVAGANQDNLEFALANGARPDRSTLFRYGNLVDRRHFTEPAERKASDVLKALGVEPGKFLLYVGRLEPIKQPEDVIATLAHVRRDGFDVKAVLAGDGSLRDKLLELARNLGVGDSVILPGDVDQGRLSILYPAAAAIISPHTGRALSEAALGGAPVVAYDVDWQSEIVETDKTGILVPHGNRQALGEAASKLLADPEYAKQLGRYIRERALKMLNQEELDEHERASYRRLLEDADDAA